MRVFDEELLLKLKDAATDMLWLLERGYRREVALKLVSERYRLEGEERSILYRSLHTRDFVCSVNTKKISHENVRGKTLVIDGLNVLGTILAMVTGKTVVIGLDGIMRDVSELHGSLLRQDVITEAVDVMISAVKALKPSVVSVVLESQVSKSGEVAALIRSALSGGESHMMVKAYTSKSVDSELSSCEGVIASSDSVILMRAKTVFDLPSYAGRFVKTEINLLDMRELLYRELY